MPVIVRAYEPADHVAGRRLWAALTEVHRILYEDPTIGGVDPGSAFDDYLADKDRRHTCVAIVDDEVVGLSGLLHRGAGAEVEPVVVESGHRGGGIGRALLDHVTAVATSQGYEYVSIRPVARNVDAIRAPSTTRGSHAGGPRRPHDGPRTSASRVERPRGAPRPRVRRLIGVPHAGGPS